jgi:hypothetical protein
MLPGVLEEARRLVRPRGLFRILAADEAELLGLPPPTRPPRRGGTVPPLALGLATVGAALEERVAELLRQESPTRALLLDSAGSAAAEEAADALERRILAEQGLARSGGASRRRFSPGYGGWPVTAQKQLFARLPHEEIGVSLLPSCLMVPRKSVSFALWLDACFGPDAGGRGPFVDQGGCPACDLPACPYRRPAPPSRPAEEN